MTIERKMLTLVKRIKEEFPDGCNGISVEYYKLHLLNTRYGSVCTDILQVVNIMKRIEVFTGTDGYDYYDSTDHEEWDCEDDDDEYDEELDVPVWLHVKG